MLASGKRSGNWILYYLQRLHYNIIHRQTLNRLQYENIRVVNSEVECFLDAEEATSSNLVRPTIETK